jgi:catechol 2,3-dioxygenase-like lactoylglutathione lyase family enzyme
MPHVLGIDHVAFAARDLEATCAFYDRLFGARTHLDYAPEGASLVRQIALGGALFSIHQAGNGLDLVATQPTVGGADYRSKATHRRHTPPPTGCQSRSHRRAPLQFSSAGRSLRWREGRPPFAAQGSRPNRSSRPSK